MEPGRGCAALLTLLPTLQPELLGASPVLKNISHSRDFNGHRAAEQRGRREPEDKVRGGSEAGRGAGEGAGGC